MLENTGLGLAPTEKSWRLVSIFSFVLQYSYSGKAAKHFVSLSQFFSKINVFPWNHIFADLGKCLSDAWSLIVSQKIWKSSDQKTCK